VAESKTKLKPLPDVGDIIFLLVTQLPLFALPMFLFSDGSTGWHLFTGNYILANGIPHHDIISYTFPDKQWVAYQWLFDVVAAVLVKVGGLYLLAVAASASIGFIFLLLYDRCRKEGGGLALVVSLCIIGAIVSAIHWLARPHLFVFFGVYLFSTALEDFYRGTIKAARLFICLTLYMVIWVNAHPAFLLAYVLISIYLACALFQWWRSHEPEKRREFKSKAVILASLLASCAALSLVNPYGLQLYQYIFNYLSAGIVLANTQEFNSPVFHGNLQPSALEILFALMFVGFYASGKKKITLPTFISCLVFGHLTLNAVRNMPLFVIVAAPAIAKMWPAYTPSTNSEESGAAPWWNKALAWWHQKASDFSETENECKMHLLPLMFVIAMVIASVSGGSLMGHKLLQNGFDPKHFPTATLKAISENKLSADHGFTFDNWGGYIRYFAGIPVFIDDRADFYGEPFYQEYGRVSLTIPGWQEILDKHKIDWILFPNNSKLVAALKESKNWRELSHDEAASLYVRKP